MFSTFFRAFSHAFHTFFRENTRRKQPATNRRLCNYHIRNVALGLFTSGPRVISR